MQSENAKTLHETRRDARSSIDEDTVLEDTLRQAILFLEDVTSPTWCHAESVAAYLRAVVLESDRALRKTTGTCDLMNPLSSAERNATAWLTFAARILGSHARGVPTTLRAALASDPDSYAAGTMLLPNLVTWAMDDRQAPGEQRAVAALRIQHCHETGHTTLDLRDLGLTSLPSGLWQVDRPLSACAAAGGLQTLRLDGNRLPTLSEDLSKLHSLRCLSVAHNSLTALPDAIGALDALAYLNVRANDLDALPDALACARALRVLRADACALRTVPAALCALRELREADFSDNILTTLPESVRHLDPACVLRLQDNPLPERVRAALLRGEATRIDAPRDKDLMRGQIRNARNASETVARGPVFVVDAVALAERDAAAVESQRDLDQAAFDWMTAGADRTGATLRRWRDMRHTGDAAAFSQFLDRLAHLPEARNGDTRSAFRRQVRDVLQVIERCPVLAQRCMACAAQVPGFVAARIEDEAGEADPADDVASETHGGARSRLRRVWDAVRAWTDLDAVAGSAASDLFGKVPGYRRGRRGKDDLDPDLAADLDAFVSAFSTGSAASAARAVTGIALFEMSTLSAPALTALARAWCLAGRRFRESTMRDWIDQYVAARPLLDCADVLHALSPLVDTAACDDPRDEAGVCPAAAASAARVGLSPAARAACARALHTAEHSEALVDFLVRDPCWRYALRLASMPARLPVQMASCAVSGEGRGDRYDLGYGQCDDASGAWLDLQTVRRWTRAYRGMAVFPTVVSDAAV